MKSLKGTHEIHSDKLDLLFLWENTSRLKSRKPNTRLDLNLIPLIWTVLRGSGYTV